MVAEMYDTVFRQFGNRSGNGRRADGEPNRYGRARDVPKTNGGAACRPPSAAEIVATAAIVISRTITTVRRHRSFLIRPENPDDNRGKVVYGFSDLESLGGMKPAGVFLKNSKTGRTCRENFFGRKITIPEYYVRNIFIIYVIYTYISNRIIRLKITFALYVKRTCKRNYKYIYIYAIGKCYFPI